MAVRSCSNSHHVHLEAGWASRTVFGRTFTRAALRALLDRIDTAGRTASVPSPTPDERDH